GYGGNKQDACGLESSAEKAIYEFTQRICQLPHLLKESTRLPPTKPCLNVAWETTGQRSFDVKVKPGFLLEDLSTARGSSKVSSNSSERADPEVTNEECHLDAKLDGLEERLLGCQFGQWRLRKRLGQGSQGRVYVGRDATGDFAVKITQLNKKHVKDRFHREVEIMKLLSHKSIVQLVSVHVEKQLAGLVLNLAEGDLLQAVSNSEKRRLKESEARHVFKQLADGVEHMHSHQIIHRDLKLENILINSREEVDDCKLYEVKITDFGSSSICDGDGHQGKSFAKGPVGTPPYIAPELLHGGWHGFPVDDWSLGISLFVMLNGYFPWKDTAPETWTFDREKSRHLSEEAKDLICRFLHLAPAERLTVANSRSHAWMTPG
ncbi:unnamed protein product, partial [Cladocopium goreaui]